LVFVFIIQIAVTLLSAGGQRTQRRESQMPDGCPGHTQDHREECDQAPGKQESAAVVGNGRHRRKNVGIRKSNGELEERHPKATQSCFAQARASLGAQLADRRHQQSTTGSAEDRRRNIRGRGLAIKAGRQREEGRQSQRRNQRWPVETSTRNLRRCNSILSILFLSGGLFHFSGSKNVLSKYFFLLNCLYFFGL